MPNLCSKQIFCQDGKVSVFPSQTGFHQGDVLGSLAFMLTIHRLLESLQEHIKEKYADQANGLSADQFLALLFVDDGYLCGPTAI